MSEHRSTEEIKALVDGSPEEIIYLLGPAYALHQSAHWPQPVLNAVLHEHLMRRAEMKIASLTSAIDEASKSSTRIGKKMVALTIVLAVAAVVGLADILVRLFSA